MKVSVTLANLPKLASQVVARLNQMGVGNSKGSALVLDQGYEILAALCGFRNQHALRAELKKNQDANHPTECSEGSSPDELTEAQVDVLRRIGFTVKLSEVYRMPFWTLEDESSEDFETEEAAWQAAWRFQSSRICRERSLAESVWAATNIECQLLMMEGYARSPMQQAISEYESRWGSEHPFYCKEDWATELASRDTKLSSYWEWVVHRIESNGGDEAHCVCGSIIDDSKESCPECGRKYA